MRLGALEAGGTKMVCAVGTSDGEILERKEFPTNSPEETIPGLISFFKENKVQALGIGSFGPICLDQQSKDYGHILKTPKLAWEGYDLYGAFKEALNIPIGLDTDVNAAAYGEAAYGISKGLNTSIYITIGTGVGVGVMANGKLLHGMLHPEGGHILLSKHENDTFKGNCPFHPNCFEGLAAGPAIEKRYGKKAKELSDNQKVWELEAYYIAQALIDYVMILSPQKIILGGGVMHQTQLFPLIRAEFKKLMNGYLCAENLNNLDTYIVPASLGDNQAVLGCFKLAEDVVLQK